MECGAAEVVVLPCNGDSIRVAEIAARTAEEGRRVSGWSQIASHAQVQGLAVIAVSRPRSRLRPGRPRHAAATARLDLRHGAITVAAKR